MKSQENRILLRAVDECGSVHRWWLEPRAGWHCDLGCPRPWMLVDWALPRGFALDRVKFCRSKNEFLSQFFSVRLQRTAGEA